MLSTVTSFVSARRSEITSGLPIALTHFSLLPGGLDLATLGNLRLLVFFDGRRDAGTNAPSQCGLDWKSQNSGTTFRQHVNAKEDANHDEIHRVDRVGG